MRKILNRGAKRRLRRKQQSARRSRTRSMIRGLEPLEDRRLLAVSPDGNWGQLISPAGPATNVTGSVAREFSIPFGADRAIAVVANYTTTSAISLFIDLDKDGTNDFKLTTQNAARAGFAARTRWVEFIPMWKVTTCRRLRHQAGRPRHSIPRSGLFPSARARWRKMRASHSPAARRRISSPRFHPIKASIS